MKRALITGANGAVGTALRAYLKAQNVEVITWNRKQTPIDIYSTMEQFAQETNPDVLFHLATASTPTGMENESWQVNYEWTSELAWITHQLGIKFVFTSSVMVFTDDAIGPFTLDSEPDATDGYGYEKLMAEKRVFHQNPNAIVARLGWQIGNNAGSNNMIDFFVKQMAENNHISASTKWYPACSFLDDTAQVLHQLTQKDGGLYQVNSNTTWTFYEIASALNIKHGNTWTIQSNEDFIYDQRMIDDRVAIKPLSERLPTLK